ADLVLMTIGANDMMKVFKRDFSHLKVEPFFNELNDFKKRLADIFKEIHAINSDAKIYLIGFYDPFSEYFPEIEELSYISSSWSTETNKVTDQFDYAYYIYTNPLFKGDVANYLSDDNFHTNTKRDKTTSTRLHINLTLPTILIQILYSKEMWLIIFLTIISIQIIKVTQKSLMKPLNIYQKR